jgi:hypothetical protein
MIGKLLDRRIAALVVGIMLFGAGWLAGQQNAATQKTLLHVFAYTPIEGATQQDFDNFRKASGDMVGKVPGLKRVWVGKLRRPLDVADSKRVYGAAMEFDNADALDAYAKNPVHTEWQKVYEKVRVEGTTTFDILGD